MSEPIKCIRDQHCEIVAHANAVIDYARLVIAQRQCGVSDTTIVDNLTKLLERE